MKKFQSIIVSVCVVCLSLGMVQSGFTQEPVTLKIMNWSQEQAEFYKEVAEEFHKVSPNITIEWETLAQSQYREALPLMFQSGDAPDIFFWISQANRNLTAVEVHDLGWAAPLAEEVSEEFLSRWPEGSFLPGVNIIDGKYYSFPFNDNKIWGPGYMFMNGDVFAAAGLDMDNPPKTWNELYETCKTVKEKAGVYCMAVPLKNNDSQRTWYPLVGSIMTDRPFDYKNGRFAINDPKQIKAFEFLQKLYNEDLLVPGVNDKAFARQSMASGQAAIYFGGTWMSSVFKSMGFENLNLGVAAPPVPDDGPVGALAQQPSENKYFISSQSKHPKEAWTFIEWMTRPDGFFAKEYVARNYGPLAFVDNAQYLEDPIAIKIAKEIAPKLRVAYPVVEVACPDAAKSRAMSEAQNIRRDWELLAISEVLTDNGDFSAVAKEIAEIKNAKFLEVLEAEAADGLKVSIDCFTFPEWDYNQDYDSANYENR